MTAYAILFTMAAIGISETVYLIRTRWAEEGEVVCPIGGGCHTVLDSKYNKLFGIHNDLLGLAFYVSAALLMSLVVMEIGPMNRFVQLVALMVLVGVAMSAYFTFLQWRIIKQWCFWCLMSAGTISIMFITLILSGTYSL